jgi:hypothetical protein
MSIALQERVGVPDDDGDSYVRVGVEEAQLHANAAHEPTVVTPPEDVPDEIAARAVEGGRALYGAIDRQQLRGLGGHAIGALERRDIVRMPSRYQIHRMGGAVVSRLIR